MGVDSPSKRKIMTHSGVASVALVRNHHLDKKKDIRAGDPSREDMLECIKSQWCWWCDSGPYKSLSQHTSKTHNINANDIRNIAGLIKRAQICSPEHSYNCAIRLNKRIITGSFKRPEEHAKGYHIIHNDEGARRASRKGKEQINRLLLISKQVNKERRKAHSCPICGKLVPKARPLYCSKECSSRAISIKSSGPKPKISETRKRLFALGILKPSPQKSKPHYCPVCGIFISKSHPLTCSKECLLEYLRQKFSKPHKCPVCGKLIRRASPLTCSPRCRQISRQRTLVIKRSS